MEHFSNSTTVLFANSSTNIAANSLKLNVRIQNWPFMSIDNSLVLVFNASSPNNPTSSCNINPGEDSSGSLQWSVVVINGVSLYPEG